MEFLAPSSGSRTAELVLVCSTDSTQVTRIPMIGRTRNAAGMTTAPSAMEINACQGAGLTVTLPSSAPGASLEVLPCLLEGGMRVVVDPAIISTTSALEYTFTVHHLGGGAATGAVIFPLQPGSPELSVLAISEVRVLPRLWWSATACSEWITTQSDPGAIQSLEDARSLLWSVCSLQPSTLEQVLTILQSAVTNLENSSITPSADPIALAVCALMDDLLGQATCEIVSLNCAEVASTMNLAAGLRASGQTFMASSDPVQAAAAFVGAAQHLDNARVTAESCPSGALVITLVWPPEDLPFTPTVEGAAIAGVVHDGSTLVAGATVTLGAESVVTDATGMFELTLPVQVTEGVPSTTFQVVATRNNQTVDVLRTHALRDFGADTCLAQISEATQAMQAEAEDVEVTSEAEGALREIKRLSDALHPLILRGETLKALDAVAKITTRLECTATLEQQVNLAPLRAAILDFVRHTVFQVGSSAATQITALYLLDYAAYQQLTLSLPTLTSASVTAAQAVSIARDFVCEFDSGHVAAQLSQLTGF